MWGDVVSRRKGVRGEGGCTEWPIHITVKSKHDKFQHFHAQQLNFVHFMCEILESDFSAKS